MRAGSSGAIGGAGGSASIVNTAAITLANANAAGLFGLASGGAGGIGGGQGSYSSAGASGAGGSGGKVYINNSAAITTQNTNSIAIFALAMGGAGGNAVSYQDTTFTGGSAGAGGNGGGAGTVAQGSSLTLSQAAVAVYNTGALSTAQVDGSGIWASASGGAGGNGALASEANGGAGGVGGTVYVKNLIAISTTGDLGRAIGAMANGGAGGVSVLDEGGAGGAGGLVTIQALHSGLETTGNTGQGIFAVANGGVGGASGLAGFTFTGSGGAGGAGGTVFVTQSGTIHTSGTTSAAIYASAAGGAGGAVYGTTALANGQSGGTGGNVTVNATLFALPGNLNTTSGGSSPGIQISVVGGNGSAGENGVSGGAGGTATLNAAGQILTAGGLSYGIQVSAQGGSGGAAMKDSNDIRGVGGAGGTGGTPTVTSSATITTSGSGASGIVITASGGNTGTSSPLVYPTGGGDGGKITLTSSGAIAVNSTVAGAGIVLTSMGGTAYTPGKGGAGGKVYATVSGSISTAGVATPSTPSQIQSPAISIVTTGGAGGSGNVYTSYTAIGDAGNGGAVSLKIQASPTGVAPSFTTQGANSPAIYVSGNGGLAGNAEYSRDYVNDGGNGGSGGEITITINSPSVITTTGNYAPGIQAQSLGGNGGNGAGGNQHSLSGGSGGNGGAGGVITIVSSALITTSGAYSPAISAISAGGTGGTGADGDDDGGNGGDGGSDAPIQGNGVSVTNSGQLTTKGVASVGILVSSTGGNGGEPGQGGDDGGNGGAGKPGGDAFALNTGGIVTSGDGSHGIAAISIGGGGYAGASVKDLGLVIVATGGAGGSGADGGSINLTNKGNIITSGANADGLFAFSVGGGGGIGGSVQAITATFALPTVNVTIGGTGGSGATGGSITLTNQGDIQTSGFDSAGINAFSAGGAGGNGGAASSSAYSLGFSEYVPTIDVTIAIAGSGGTGGDGGVITLTNTGNVSTLGDISPGLYALSIGGGGGDGGNATTQVYSYGTSPQVQIGVTIGGSGGAGGSGQTVTLENNGLGTISTAGFASDALQALSIGGGGGNGGTGTSYVDTTIPVVGDALDWLPLPFGSTYSYQSTIGGNGGSGGIGGAVIVTNSATLITAGIDSRGIFAQSVGGSGGNAPAGKASSSADMTIKSVIGGSGGNGGNGGAVNVTNEQGAAIQTASDGAHGIFAQSIGAGGGSAGTSSADSFDSEATATGSQITRFTLGQIIESYLPNFAKKTGTSGDISPSISINTVTGGSGGAGGIGGDVTISNFGSIVTGLSTTGGGDFAVGMLAQSVGGGGGTGGAATVSGGRIVNSNTAVGGSDGALGSGGAVVVNASGSVATSGGSAFGMLAQSIGGGGGIAGLATGAATIELDMTVALGGSLAEASSNTPNSSGGGTVTVNAASGSSFATSGNEAHAIVAQSVGGGGGLFYINGENYTLIGQQDYQQTLGNAVAALFPIGPFATLSDMVAYFEGQVQAASGTLTLNFGGGQASASQSTGVGSGNTVTINASGKISTSGANAFGILAQSIGGGGGFSSDGAGPGVANLTIAGSFGNSSTGTVPMSGNTVTINLGAGSAISTTGSGATAILAQSIGGGGGYLGALDGNGAFYTGFLSSGAGYGLAVNANTAGGAISVTSIGTTSISTTGANAHGIFAQSLSGGGGLIANASGIVMPVTASNGRGDGFSVADDFNPGEITISFLGSLTTTGADSIAIYAQSGVQGGAGSILRSAPSVTSGDITVTINGGTVVGGSYSGAAIMLDGGATNTVNIESEASVSALSGLAVLSPWGATTVNNFGTLTGNLTLSDGAAYNGTFNNQPKGVFNSLSEGLVNVGSSGTFSNQGLFNVAGVGTIGTTSVSGTFTQTTSGVIAIDINAANARTADMLSTSTASSLNGYLQMNVLGSVLPQAYAVMTQSSNVVPMSTASLDLNTENGPGRYLTVNWAKSSTASTLSVTPKVNFVTPGLNANQTSYATNLQATWSAGGTAPLGVVYANFINQPTAAAYQAAINAASPAALASGPLTRMASARSALSAVLSCPYFSDSGTLMGQGDCTWARIDAGTARYTPNDGTAYSLDTLTYRIGGQKEIAPGWFVGASAAYNLGWYDSGSGLSSTDGQGVDLSASLKHQIGPWLISGAVHAGYASYDASRQSLPGSSAYLSECGYDVWTVGGRLRLEYEMPFQTWYLKPYGQLDMVYANVPSFSESGASPYNLSMKQTDSLMLAFGPHLEIGGRLDLDGGATLRPFASVGATFFSNGSWGVTASMQYAPAPVGTFQTVVDLPDVVADLGVGLQLSLKSGLDLRLNYEAEVGTDYLAHFGSARLSYRF